MSARREALLIVLALAVSSVRADPLVVGSKVFTESVILAEMTTQLLVDAGYDTSHRRELGGTRVLWSALLRGDVDCYPEYTGTLRAEIFPERRLEGREALERALSEAQVWMSPSLGFNNTYVLGMRRDRASALGLTRISQLAQHP